MRTNLKTRSGNRIVAMFDGKQIGAVQSVRMNDDYSPEPMSGIGDIHVHEYVPTMARHNLQVQTMVLNKGSMREAGITMENGDGVLQGLVFDIEVYSKDDGTLLRKYIGCSYASGDLEISKHAIVMASGQFMALDVVGTIV
ncbi:MULTISPECIES: hypothetical protein [unclassified Nitrosomonas]|jgi:hypothetical protein|uniref:hypothetical protein n=1 Tax=unclassified Nitrosomonas TaxID=2609265 RepID=UPI000887E2AF|nr:MULTISPECIES: hypothetical protein [unclassified Nitrosomonas]SDH27363.1 hypothetical protein SAMN05428952_100980 [Nitrosomonas sp. Nm132]SDY39279.1 hypothetical protein SAMN05421754_100876 [Nitrosomonas sp. Nm58]